MPESSRRRFLRGTVALALASVAGCLGENTPDGSSTEPPGDDRGTPPSTPTTGEPSPSPAPPQTSPPGTETPPQTTTGGTPPREPGTQTPTDAPHTQPPPAGPVAWWHAFSSGIEATPVVSDSAVYAATRSGPIARFDAATGTVEWSITLEREVRDLAVSTGALLALEGSYELGSDQRVVALDPADGTERWSISPGDWWLQILATRDDVAYIATTDDAIGESGQELYAIALADGTTRWSAGVGDPRAALIAGNALVVSSYGHVRAYDRHDGTVRWDRDLEEGSSATMTATDETLIVGREREDSPALGLVGVDLVSGADRWQFNAWGISSATAGDALVFIGGQRVAALDPQDGSRQWTSQSTGFVSDAGLTGDGLYAGGDGIVAYDRASGSRAWSWTPDPAQGGVFPAGIDGGTIWVDSYHDAHPRNQYKFGVGVADGADQWTFEDGTDLTDLAVADGIAATGGRNGRLYVLE